jgi:hypothetical protein
VALAYLVHPLLLNTEVVLLAISTMVIDDVLGNNLYYCFRDIWDETLHIINGILRFNLKSVFDKACAKVSQKRIINSYQVKRFHLQEWCANVIAASMKWTTKMESDLHEKKFLAKVTIA